MVYLTGHFCLLFVVISDDVISSHPRGPLHVVSGGRYSGSQLKTLINSLQGKLEGNLPIDEFKVTYFRDLIISKDVSFHVQLAFGKNC